MRSVRNERYALGLWTDSIPFDLLWHRADLDVEFGVAEHSASAQLPSWTWATLGFPVNYPAFNGDVSVDARVSMQAEPVHDLGEVRQRQLAIGFKDDAYKGKLLKIITHDDETCTSQSSRTQAQRLQKFRYEFHPSLDGGFGIFGCRVLVYLDEPSSHPATIDVYILMILSFHAEIDDTIEINDESVKEYRKSHQTRSNSKDTASSTTTTKLTRPSYYCLVLQPVLNQPDPTVGYYRRVGFTIVKEQAGECLEDVMPPRDRDWEGLVV